MIDLACHANVLVPVVADPRFGAAIEEIADMGYRRIVLPFFADSDAAADVVERCREYGIEPIAMCRQTPDRDVSSADAATAAAGEQWLRAQVDLVADLGIDHITGLAYGVFGTATSPVDDARFVATAQRVGAVAEDAHARGVMLTCEVLNRYETAFMNTAARAVEFVRASGSHHLRLHLDTFHMAIEETSILDAIHLALPHLGYLELGQSGRGELASGVLEIDALVAATLDAGYDGRWGIEAFSSAVLTEASSAALSIWRAPYRDGVTLARDAMTIFRRGVSARTHDSTT